MGNRPGTSERTGSAAGLINKLSTPIAQASYQWQAEKREELPFHRQFDGLTYIGMTSYETWRVPPHYHDHFELCYVDEGQGWFSLDGRFYPVKQGDMFLTKPGENHQGAAAGDRPFRLYYAGFHLNDMARLEDDFYRIGYGRVVADLGGAVKSLFDLIFDEIAHSRIHSALMAHSHFVALLVNVIRSFRDEQPGPPGEGGTAITPIVKDLLEFLHEKVAIGVQIGELAREYHLSRTHLEREFKRCIGIPLGKYMRSLCMERAKYWLQQPGASVTGVAERLGFSSIHSFSVFFKRHSGLSPQDYKKGRSGKEENDEKR